jgi:surfeit locus 1 family protein
MSEPGAARPPGRAYRVLVVGGLAAAVCVRLGFWQLDRLKQRDALRQAIRARQEMPAVDLSAARAMLGGGPPPAGAGAGDLRASLADTLLYRRAVATGTFDFEHQVVVVGRVVAGLPAVLVVTPLRVEEGLAILVERGWVPSPDAASVNLLELAEPEVATVGGVLLQPGGRNIPSGRDARWPLVAPTDDPLRLGDRFPYRLLPWVLRRTEAPGAGTDGLRALAVPQLDRGPHLSYAVQWFAFAAIAVAGSVALFMRSGPRPQAGEGGPAARGGSA